MEQYRRIWKERVEEALSAVAEEEGHTIDRDAVAAETPPSSELGDIGFPMFPFARVFRTSPQNIAGKVAERIADRYASASQAPGTVTQEGPYVNAKLDRPSVFANVLDTVLSAPEQWGRTGREEGRRVMVEFSCPNTNKPLHLGHLRNDALGESVSRMLDAAGATVRKVNLINDRGIHICKSMLAYLKLGEGSTPESEGKKSDHFVGDYYVKYEELVRENPKVADEAADLLRRWEQGDPEVMELWKRMNDWAVSGIEESYRATGVTFDQIYLESETYTSGRDEVLRGLEQGVFFRAEDGSVWVDLEDVGLDKKVLLRSDGTSLYLTQDIGTAIARYRDWPFDRLIYVVASEQRYHFQVLFTVLSRLGFEWADSLYHLAYGMVNLPHGKMKSREGTVVDADDLLAELQELAAQEIHNKERADVVGDVPATARSIALGALHYYLLQATPNKDMVFDPAASISFTGNTGPYLQYMGARISSIVRKSHGVQIAPWEELDLSVLSAPEEWDLIKLVSSFPDTVSEAASELNPALLANHLYDLAKLFSRYYHEHPVITNDDPALRGARLALCRAVAHTLRAGLPLIGVPFLETM